MKTDRPKNPITVMMLVLPILLFSTVSRGDTQVNSTGLISGQSAGGNGLAEPNFLIDPDQGKPVPSYDLFVEPNGFDFRVVEFGEGSINVLDGNALRRFTAGGEQIIDPAFPVLCTNIFVPQPKRNDPDAKQSLSACTSMLSLPDGTFRLFGSDKGKKLVSYKYDPATANCTPEDEDWDPLSDPLKECSGSLAVAGAPPQAAEAVVDSNELTSTRAATADAYWLVADKNSVYLFELETDFTTGQLAEVDSGKRIQRISGKNLTGIAPFTNGQVIVADDDGMLYRLNKDGGGTWTTTAAKQMPTYGDNKTEQNFRVQSDENEELLYVSNQAGGRIDILNPDDNLTEFQPTLMLDDPQDFFPSDIDIIGAILGSWDECASGGGGICPVDNTPGAGYVQDVDATPPAGGDNTFTGKKFVLQDCRYEPNTLPPNVDCPVACPAGYSDIKECDLDVIALALIADPSFADLLPDPNGQGLLPWWLRADLEFPSSIDGEPVDNKATFFYYHVKTSAAFENLATAIYDIDVIRGDLAPETLPDGGDELCPDPQQEQSVLEVNERTNMIAYLPDFFDTVRCDFDDPSQSACSLETVQKSAFIAIDDCTNPRRAPVNGFSGHVVGIEAASETVDTFRNIASLQNAELQAFKDKVLCDATYAFPDGTLAGIDRSGLDDAILSQFDCGNIQGILDQTAAKWAVCGAASNPSQGNSAENCNALFTQIGNLETIIETGVLWPEQLDPADSKEFLLLKMNPKGEFLLRLRAFTYGVSNWWLGSNAAPLLKITAPADGFTEEAGELITFEAIANDLEDDDVLLTSQIEWTSDPDGPLGTGGSLTIDTLSVGAHVITASVTDGDGITSTASIRVTITEPTP